MSSQFILLAGFLSVVLAGARSRLVVRLRHQLHVRVPHGPFSLPLRVHLEYSLVVTVQSAGLQQLPGESLTGSGHPAGLCVVLLGPADLLQEVREVPLDGNVVGVGLQAAVEELVVVGVLLENQAAAQHQVGEAIRCHCAIHVHLVLVLQRTGTVNITDTFV